MTRLRAPRNGREHAGPLAALIVPLPRAIAIAVALAMALPPAPLLAQAPAKPAAAGRAAPAEDTASLNFVNADLEATVRAIGQYTGRQFVIDPRVKGTINLVTERPVTKEQAYEQLLSALRLQGFTIVESPGGISRILPEADAKLQGGRVIAPSQQAPRGDQIVTQVFEMQYESATNMVPVLRPLIAPNNTISAYPANNSLVITDYADNLRRIRDIIAAIDRPASAESEIITLKYGLALEIATVANRILDEGARAAGQATDGGQRVQVLAEPRTNSLILRTSSRARAFAAKQLIEKLDQPSVTPGNINVVYLRNAQAVRLAQTLRAVISADPSFTPQTGGTGGLSAGGSAFGSSTTGQAGITQQQQQPQIQPQQIGGTGGGGGGSGPLAGMIQADPSTNSLIITAPEPLYRNIRTIIEKLDVRPAQVVIESLIVEVTADKAAEFGIQWQALGGFSEENSNNTSVVGGTNFGGAGTNIIGAAVNPTTLGAGLNLGIIRGTVTIAGQEITNLGFLARALETSANGNVLAQPNIQTLDNEEAKFLVGQNVPFVTGSFTQAGQAAGAVNPFQTFERRDVGLQLRVKPQISEGGNVRLAIYLEVSSVVPGTLQGGVITNKRSFESNVVVEDGNFVVLSGLIEDRTTNSESRVPLLGSIPGIGWLFRYENRDRKKTNTMVFLRPVVVRDEATSAVVAANRYEYMRTQTQQAQKPDNWVLRGYEGNQLPPLDQISPPSKPRGAVPTPSSPNPPTAPGATPPAAAPAPAAAAPVAPAPTGNFAASASSPPPKGAQQLLQVMATSDVARGRELSKQLREAGFDAFWESVRAPGRDEEIVRVRVAVDPSAQTLSAAIADLRRRGLEPVPVTP
jgi:general secretion pathway protein D